MTDLETLQRAKMYMDKLTNGIDPVSNTKLPEDTALNSARLSRCFSYVSDILRQVIENGGVVGKRQATLSFSLTPEQRASLPLPGHPLLVSEFVDLMNQAANPEMKKLYASTITNWLLLNGFLEKRTGTDGRPHRLPTEKGKQIGLSTENRANRYGEFQAVLYDSNAQKFVLDNLDAILAEG